MEPLRRLADQLNIADSIAFMGAVPAERMPQLYRDNHIFVMSSAHEGMSNAMLEAMASGLPIITTRCEGAEELIEDNGIVVEDPCAEALAEAVKELADNQQEYKLMSIAARNRAERFSWSSTAEEYLKLYESII